jgi:AraC-like DNA-binding protein
MMEHREQFVQNRDLAFAEARRSTGSARHFKPHLHRRLSIGAIDRGEVIYEVDGQKARLGPGALALINPDTLHACNPVGSQARSYFMLYLETSWCAKVQKTLFSTDVFLPLDRICLDHEHLFRRYRQLMDRLLGGRANESELVAFSRALFLRTCQAGEPTPPVRLRIEQLKKELSTDLRHPLPLETLARRHGINPYTLLRQFKKATGVTPHAFRLNRQISRARELLRRGMDPATVATECGFYDQSHMHRHFRAMTTVTPGEYQQNF